MSKLSKQLPAGSQVDNYIIDHALGGGGFSIVYLAKPKNSDTPVVIKEYMPSTLAKRNEDLSVSAIDDHHVERFAHGRRLFFQEASTLTTLKHDNIVDVINFFRANGTVYMVMKFEEGHNLQSYIKRHKGGLSEKFVNAVFLPLLGGLREIHTRGLLHLDIKPGNIHLRQGGGNPILLDFGAVHEMMHSRQFQPNQVVTPGYSPIEQLDPGGYVGPWTDIYAMGATMRTCMSGKPPPPSIQRRERDTMRSAVNSFKKNYSTSLLKAIDWAMEVDPMMRPQSVDQLLDAMQKDSDDDSVPAGRSG